MSLQTSDLAALASVPPPVRPVNRISGRLLDLVFPARCAGCGSVGELFCAACRGQVQPVPQPLCIRCGKPAAQTGRCPACRDATFQVAAIRAAAVYREPLSQIIHDFKYNGRRELGQPLGELLAAYWRGRSVSVDVVIAVPLHEHRLKERGFNQSQLLAEALCWMVSLPLLQPEVLRRQRDTQHQVHLAPAERRANVSGAFEWIGPHLGGARALLIDDVATTGATLEACGEALHAAGAGRVWALTVARSLGEQSGAQAG
ncbi:MAG: ComF family protein [Caldilineales bacterium]